jgi:hypothetical protein
VVDDAGNGGGAADGGFTGVEGIPATGFAPLGVLSFATVVVDPPGGATFGAAAGFPPGGAFAMEGTVEGAEAYIVAVFLRGSGVTAAARYLFQSGSLPPAL